LVFGVGFSTDKLNLTRQKQTGICNKIYCNTTKLKPGLVGSYDHWPGHGMGLFLRK